MARIFVYKLTNDSGIAPCVTPATSLHGALLSLAICKPAIRRSADVGDYIIGLSSRFLADTKDYPPDSIIYCTKVDRKLRGEDYYARDGQADASEYRYRMNRIYIYHESSKRYSVIPNQTGHTEADMSRELGEYSNVEKQSYKNS